MKRLPLSLTLLAILSLPLAALADYEQPAIALVCDDTPPGVCHVDLEAFTPVKIDMDLTGFAGFRNPVAEIRYQMVNVPADENFPYGDAAFAWYVSGVDHDEATHVVVIACDPPLTDTPETLELGRLTLVPYGSHADWVGDDHAIGVDAAWVKDIYGQTYWAAEGAFTLNCTGACDCFPAGAPQFWLKAHAVSPAMGGDVIDVFSFEFTLESFDLIGGSPQPYSGEILVDGQLAFTFAGVDVQAHAFAIDTAGMSPGSPLTVEVIAANDEHPYVTTHLTVLYEIDDGVAAEAADVSRLKAMY